MFKIASIIFSFLLFGLNAKTDSFCVQYSIDSVFTDWNKATFASMVRQKQASMDSKQKALYENRLSSIKKYWKVKELDEFNSQSIRHKFLKVFFEDGVFEDQVFYIFEANEYGSKVLLRNFVLRIYDDKSVEVDFYDFVDNMWNKTGSFKRSDFYFQSDLKSYLSPFGKGCNNDDIVITKFRGKKVEESEYYLYSTLSVESKIKVVLEGYRKENFIK